MFSLFLDVKRAGRSLAATSIAGLPHPGRLFYIHDRNSDTHFLVDTGAEVSVIPPTRLERARPQSAFSILGVDGSHIATYGVRSCTLNLGLRRTFRWIFVLADVKRAILGADFLQHFGLVVDMSHRTLLDSTSHLEVNGLPSRSLPVSPELSHVKLGSPNAFLSLLSEFPALTQACAIGHPIQHDVVHHIETTGPPVSARTRRLAPERHRNARQEFDHMLELGIIRPSSSNWSSALHMVPKHTPGDWRPCGGFCGLNRITVSDRYPFPH